MHRFLVLDGGQSPEHWPLRNAHMIGSDGSAVRADISFDQGMINCEKREGGSAALALQHRAGDLGEMTLQTCLLPERDDPYLLSLELARHRMMTLYAKLEDWAMFDLGADHPVSRRVELGRRLFIDALCAVSQDIVRADGLAHNCLVSALDGSEELALAHAELLLNRRKDAAALPKAPIGCGVRLDHAVDQQRAGIAGNFDFVLLPTPWKQLAPTEGAYHWRWADDWTDWTSRNQLPVIAGPLVNFDPACLPGWLYIWEHDYDTVRDLMYEHMGRVVERYKHAVMGWNVVSGLHVNSHFSFNFEQLIDLTRMAVMLVKKVSPQALALVEIRQPFGEYYGSNQRSIPPLIYADLVTQSAITIDGFAIRLLLGQALPGQYTRDLMQISNLLDTFSVFGKPLYLTIGAPSIPMTQIMTAPPAVDGLVDADSGFWRRPWSPLVQSHWLEAVFQIAISKPFVEAVAWQELIDHPELELCSAGLMDQQLQPKGALLRLIGFRRSLLEEGPTESVTLDEPPQPEAEPRLAPL